MGYSIKISNRWWIIIALCLFGTALFGLGVAQLVDQLHTSNWPHVPGRIQTSAVEKQRSKRSYFLPKVTYEYEVDGRRFEGNRIQAERSSIANRSEARAREVISAYQVGAVIPVYYNPKQPALSALKRGVSAATFFMIGLGILVAALGASSLCAKLRSART